MVTSRIPGFYKLSLSERRHAAAEVLGVKVSELESALGLGGLDAKTADKTIENVVGTYAMPFALGLNLQMNGRDYLVPMVVEAATATWLALFPPAAVGRGAAIAGLSLVAIVVVSTVLVQVPLHESLRSGDAPAETVKRLVRSTRIRTAAWTARAILAAWMLHATAVAG